MTKVKRRKVFAVFLSLMLVLTQLPGMAFATENSEIVTCQKAEGCVLADGHAGECQFDNPDSTSSEPADNSVTDPAAMIGTQGYETLAEAIAAAEDGETVTLMENVSVASQIAIEKPITLNLNGKSITNLVAEDRLFNVTAAAFTVDGTTSGSAMTIPDENEKSYGFIKVAAASTVTLNGGIYSGNTDNGAFVKIFHNDTIDASGSTVIFNGTEMFSNGRFFDTDTLNTPVETPTLQVTGGTYKTAGMAFSVDTLYRSSVTFKEVTVTAETGPCIEMAGSEGTFENCTFKVINTENASHFSATAVSVSYDGSATIDGGTYESTGYGAYVYSSGGIIVIKDGTVAGGVAAVKADVDSTRYPDAQSSVIVEGGTTDGAWQTNGNEKASLTAMGGVHTADITEFLAEGCTLVEVDGKYTVNEAQNVQVGEQYYGTLERAFANAKSGETVKLLTNMELSETVEVSKTNITLDLNGYTVSGSIASNGLIKAVSGATLTVTDTSTEDSKGALINSGASTSRAVYVDKGATLVLNGGVNLRAEGTSNMNYAAALYIASDDSEPPDVTIHDATLFASKGYAIRFSSSVKAAKLVINGGSFTASTISAAAQAIANDKAENVTIKGGTFYNWSASMDTPLVADGYSIVVDKDNYVTIQENAPADYIARIEEANAYLTGGDLFNLIQRVGTGIIDTTMEIVKNVTCTYLDGSGYNSNYGFGNSNESQDPSAMTIEIASGATLSGNMPLYVADVTVTGGGKVDEGFFKPVNDTYIVTSETTSGGTIYKGRLNEENVVAIVTVTGTDYRYADLGAAISRAYQNADSVLTLQQNVTYDGTASANNHSPSGWTLDLNGHTYTYTGSGDAFQVQSNGKYLTITDNSDSGGGKIIATSANSAIATTKSSTAATVTIEKGAVIEGCILITGTDATLNVYGTVDTTDGVDETAAIQNNGSDTVNSTINLYDDAEIKSNAVGIYHPGPGTLNVYGATVTGNDVGIEMRAGTLNIYENANVNGGNGTPSSAANSSGSTSHNAAVAVAQHTTQLPVTVNVYGGTLTGGASVYETNPQQNEETATKQIRLNLRDGNFNGSVSSVTQEDFITGGIYSQKPDDKYIYPGLVATENAEQPDTFIVTRTTDVIYVDGVQGDDNNTGEDSDHAVKTLSHAVSLIADGGTIYICGEVIIDESMDIRGVAIKRADGYAGDMIKMRGIHKNSNEQPVNLTLSRVTIDGNKEGVKWEELEGYPYITCTMLTVGRGSTVRLEEGTVLKNNYDAAIYVTQETENQPRGNLIIDGAEITENGNDTSSGGGVYNAGYLKMIDGEISDNTAQIGGGICTNIEGEAILSGGIIKDNTASYSGGGIHMDSGRITLSGTSVTKNSAAYYGGGIDIYVGTCILDGSSVTSNNAGFYGGGVMVQKDDYQTDVNTFEVRSGEISDNSAGYYGGGIMLQNTGSGDRKAVLDMQGGQVFGNKSMDNIGSEIYGSNFYDGDIIVQFTGGTISGATERAIAFSMDKDENSELNPKFPTLELAGTPNISGGIILWGSANATRMPIQVTGALQLQNSIPIEDQTAAAGDIAVTYADGLTPDEQHFVTATNRLGLKTDGGQNIIWTVEEPTVQTDAGANATLSAGGTKVTITINSGYTLQDVTLNGVSLGKVTEVTGLRTGDIVVVTTAGSGGSGPVVQKPTIETDDGAEVTLSDLGTKATITVDADYELQDVTLNGVSLGKVTEVTGLRTGDKLVITTVSKAQLEKEYNEYLKAGVKHTTLKIYSKSLASGGKGNGWIRIYWVKSKGFKVDGYEVYRGTSKTNMKRYDTTKGTAYRNAKYLKKGTRYYYKVRGYRTIGGEKVYTGWSKTIYRIAR